MKKETRHLIRKLLLGSLALLVFSVAILSTIRMALPEVIDLWVVLIVSFGSVLLFIGVILLIELFAKKRIK